MDDDALWSLFQILYDDIDDQDQFYNAKPLLAHYTSLEVLEKILTTNEIWFSNPLFMNDLEEVRFGFVHGATEIKNSQVIRTALGTDDRHKKFMEVLDYYIADFEEKHLLDTYVFCLSEHDLQNQDGMLSMWRGYGGNGRGAALVFDTTKLIPVENGPLALARVRYGSPDERFEWFGQMASTVADILIKNDIPDDKIYLVSNAIFQRIKLFALFTKHHGFKEEKEWRVVHASGSKHDGKLKPMQHYVNGPRGVEPKLKFKLEPTEGVTPPDFSLAQTLASILLGPSTSSILAVRSVERMLDLIGRPELKDRLVASSIPLRAT